MFDFLGYTCYSQAHQVLRELVILCAIVGGGYLAWQITTLKRDLKASRAELGNAKAGLQRDAGGAAVCDLSSSPTPPARPTAPLPRASASPPPPPRPPPPPPAPPTSP